MPKYFQTKVISEDEILLLGGYDLTNKNSSNSVFRVIGELGKNGQIEKIAPMHKERQYFGMTLTEKYLYVIGGYSKNENILSYSERFNLKARRWEELEDLTSPRLNCSACHLGAHIFVFGGIGP